MHTYTEKVTQKVILFNGAPRGDDNGNDINMCRHVFSEHSVCLF